MIFDCIVSNISFAERYKLINQAVPENHDYILFPPLLLPFLFDMLVHLRVSTYTVCTSKQHLHNLFSAMVANSAEGIVVRDPEGRYVPGLSKQVFKFRVCVFPFPYPSFPLCFDVLM